MTDKALEYKSLIYKINVMIDNVKELGINVDEYNNLLKNIIYNVENNVNESKEKDMACAFLTLDYSYGIRELKKLELVLINYDVYSKAINACNYLDIQMLKLTEVKDVKKYSSKIIEVLRSIRNSETLHYEDEKKVIEKVYDTVYNVVKLEIIVTGKSEVYDYVKDYDIDLYILNNLVNNDIDKLDLNDKKYLRLKERMYEVNSKGINKSYFDIEIIRLLLFYDKKFKLKDIINNNINSILDEIKVNNRSIDDKLYDYRDKKRKLEELRNNLNLTKCSFIRNSISLSLILSTLVGIGVGIYKVNKNISSKEYYSKSGITYSEWNGKNSYEELISVKEGNLDDKRLLKVYGAWENIRYHGGDTNQYERDIKIYDITSYNCGDLEHYVTEHDIDYYGVDYIKEQERQYYVTELYKNEYVEVEEYKIDKSQVIEKFDHKGFKTHMIWSYIIYCIMVLLISGVTEFELIFGNIENFYYSLKNVRFYKKEKDDGLENLNTTASEIMNIINSNEILKEQFNKVYEENKFLLTNPEELYSRFNNLVEKMNTENVKKLIREKA